MDYLFCSFYFLLIVLILIFFSDTLKTIKMSGLTEEQRKRMEENKRKALAKRAQAKAQNASTGPTSTLIRPVSSSSSRPVSSSSIRPVPSSSSRPVSSTATQNKPSSGAYNNNRQAPSSGNYQQQQRPLVPSSSSALPSTNPFMTGKTQRGPQQTVQSNMIHQTANTGYNSGTVNTYTKPAQTQAKTFYSSNPPAAPSGGNVNRSQGSWRNRPNNGNPTSFGQYRNQSANFQTSGQYGRQAQSGA